MRFSLFSPVREWCASDHHMPLLCRRFSSVAPDAALPAHLTVCKATAPDGAGFSACLPPHCGLFSADGLSGGNIHDHIPFQLSRGEICTSQQNFLPQASKTFASAPGQLPRDVVSIPRRKGPTAGKSPKTRTAEGASLLREMTWPPGSRDDEETM